MDETRWAIAPNLTTRAVGEQRFVVTAQGWMVILDNPTAAALWDHLLRSASAGANAHDLEHVLLAEFDAPEEKIAADIVAFVARLQSEGLITVI